MKVVFTIIFFFIGLFAFSQKSNVEELIKKAYADYDNQKFTSVLDQSIKLLHTNEEINFNDSIDIYGLI